jgi:ubiquinol-cytochrome c reductase cytochrome b subunit
MIITAFLGYVLPWGQMSYWAATVITSLVGVFPKVGESLLIFLWGGFYIDQQTLTKFYALHFLLPFVILGLVIVHVIFLHEYGSNNPLGMKSYKDGVPFGPYFITKDIFGVVLFIFLFAFLVFFMPNLTMHPDNYIKANFEVTPEHIVPEWYFLPFYGLLRSVPNKILGVLCLLSGLIALFLIPFVFKSLVRSGKFKPLYKIMYWFFVGNCILLGWSGGKPVADPYFPICCFSTLFYFFILIILFPIINAIDDELFVIYCKNLSLNKKNKKYFID